ncbi:hypothetical protein [Lacrimispora indolis]|uniref:hypothetical protein n=1 Tax=Lacrimispora indolis TaxID=69825 RepID=UPI00041B19DE|nr:hypothetical protein [[Clostridium] methoxybenzovorans]
MRRKAKDNIVKKFIHYPAKTVFAIYYLSDKVIYYNLDFNGKAKKVLMIPNELELSRHKIN